MNLVVARPLKAGGNDRQDESHETYVVAQCHGGNVGPLGTLRAGNGSLTGGVPFVARALTAPSSPRFDGDTENFVVAHTLTAEGHDASEDGTGRGVPLVTAHTLRGNHCGVGQGHNTTYIPSSMGVRRLTPRECERLQGLPDDHTDIGGPCRKGRCHPSGWSKDHPTPDSPRYRALGNGMAVPVVEWICRRILAACGGAA